MSDDRHMNCVRAPHDPNHPYLIVARNLAQDFRISLESRGLLLYVLSLPSDWKANALHLGKVNGIGKDKIYSILKELIAFGYCTKESFRSEQGTYHKIIYTFHETAVYLKEKVPQADLPEAVEPDAVNPELHIYTYSTGIDNKQTPPIPPQPAKEAEASKPAKAGRDRDFSQEVLDTSKEFIDSMKDVKPDYASPKNMKPIHEQIDAMIRIEKRSPEKIIRVLKWSLADDTPNSQGFCWSPKMFKKNPANYLREKFDQIEMQMNISLKKSGRVVTETKVAPKISIDPEMAKLIQEREEEMKKRNQL